MTNQLKTIFFIFIICLLSCEEDTVIVIPYTAHIQNNTMNTYKVYLKSDAPNAIFISEGTVLKESELEIRELSSNLNYTVRLVKEANTVENYDYEKKFFSDNIDVTISFP